MHIFHGLVCSAGDSEDFLSMLQTSAPHLPEDARKAAVRLIKSRPEFYPLPHWNWLSQLHGPKVHMTATSLYNTVSLVNICA